MKQRQELEQAVKKLHDHIKQAERKDSEKQFASGGAGGGSGGGGLRSGAARRPGRRRRWPIESSEQLGPPSTHTSPPCSPWQVARCAHCALCT